VYYENSPYDNQTNGPPAEGSRYLHLRRKVRSETPGTPREKENDGPGIGRQNRDTVSNASQMGIGGSLSDQRTNSHSCRSSRNQAWNSHSKPLKNILKKIAICINSHLTIIQTAVILCIVPQTTTSFRFPRPRYRTVCQERRGIPQERNLQTVQKLRYKINHA